MQTKSVTIRVQTLDGVWETTGVDRLRGVWPENDSYTADEWGSSKCSFDLHRDAGAIFPDLQAFTPIEVEIGGVLVWSGRILETPIREGDRVFNVQGQGWQYHLDDDCYDRKYVHATVSDYRDLRSFAGADLTKLYQGGTVASDRGVLTIGMPKGVAMPISAFVGAQVDLGLANGAARFSFDWQVSNNDASILIIVRSGVTDDPFIATNITTFANNVGVTSGTTTATVPVTAQYISIWMFNNSGTVYTPAADVYLKVVGARCFASAAYESGNQSILKATQIVPDALDRATSLLSSDRSQIDPAGTVTFAFPEFALDGQHTPREVLQAANAVHDYTLKVDVRKRLAFAPKTSAPRAEIGAWPGSVFDDASANSGDEIYNRVVVEGTGVDGALLSVQRAAGQQAGLVSEIVSTPAPSNPSFAVDASSWTASAPATINRVTTAGLFDTAPAGGQWLTSPAAIGATLSETFTGTFQAGVTYRLALALANQGPFQGTPFVDVTWGSGSDVVRARWPGVISGAFAVQVLSWTPAATYASGVTLNFTEVVGHAGAWLIDSLVLSVVKPTLVDRRGFRRTHILPIKNSLTQALGQQIGDVWLAAHKTTPLKGTVQVTGDRATREILTGASVPPERLLTMTGELLRLSHRVDPDTGGHGRDGRIAEVTYTPETDTAVIAIDSRRTSHEALLERLAVVVGSG